MVTTENDVRCDGDEIFLEIIFLISMLKVEAVEVMNKLVWPIFTHNSVLQISYAFPQRET